MSIYDRPGSPFKQMYIPGSELKAGRDVRVSTKCTNDEDARRFEAVYRSEYGIPSAAALVFEKSQSITFKELISRCVEKEWQKKKSWISYFRPNVNKLLPFFGEMFLDKITVEHVEAWAKNFEAMGPRSVNGGLAVLRRAFNLAKGPKLKRIFKGDNPVCVEFATESKPRIRFIENHDQQRLLAACEQPLQDIALIALRMGFRRGEIYGLRVKNVDFKRRMIDLSDETKGGDVRSVPFLKEVEAVLRVRTSGRSANDLLFSKNDLQYFRVQDLGKSLKKGTGKDRRLGNDDLRCYWDRACKRAQIENFHFHDLRHTFASDSLMSGITLPSLQYMMGHKSLDQTMQYAHLSKGFQRSEIEKLELYIARQQTASFVEAA